MQIKNINVSNFKTFEEINVDLEKFNVLIGANASGKSNFINVFQFIKDVVENGLDNAISLQGGIDYIKNINIGASEKFSIELQHAMPRSSPAVGCAVATFDFSN